MALHITRKRDILWPTRIIICKKACANTHSPGKSGKRQELRERRFLIQRLNLSNKRTRELQLQPIPTQGSGSAHTHGRAHTAAAAAAAARPLLCLGLTTQKRQSPHLLLQQRHLSRAAPCTGHLAFSGNSPNTLLFFPTKQSLVEPTKHHHKCPCTRHSSQGKGTTKCGQHRLTPLILTVGEDFFIPSSLGNLA